MEESLTETQRMERGRRLAELRANLTAFRSLAVDMRDQELMGLTDAALLGLALVSDTADREVVTDLMTYVVQLTRIMRDKLLRNIEAAEREAEADADVGAVLRDLERLCVHARAPEAAPHTPDATG